MPARRTPLLGFLIFFAAAVPTALSPLAAGSRHPRSATFELYPADSNLGRTSLVHDETASARPILMRRGTHIFQVFIHTRTGRELFRVNVGTTEATFWVYGLVREADFNGDGIPDFSWHGGDDVSELNLLVLSSATGYKKIDLGATLQREWRRRFPSDPQEGGLMQEPVFSQMQLLRRSGKLQLEGRIRFSDYSESDGIKSYEHLLLVDQQDFVYLR